jgi:hypothetical protein
MALTAYLTATQRLLHDTSGTRYPTIDLTAYINTARSQLALEGECVRVLYGADYSTTNNTVTNQETYNLPTTVATNYGIKDVISVRSVSVNYGGQQGSNQYMLSQMDFTGLQAFYRFYGPNLVGNPAVWAFYQNKIYLRPIPSQVYPMQWDTMCSVIDLVDNTTPEAIPYPFTDCVPYYAAYMAYLNSQREADAKAMKVIYEEFAGRARKFVQRTYAPNVYSG